MTVSLKCEPEIAVALRVFGEPRDYVLNELQVLMQIRAVPLSP